MHMLQLYMLEYGQVQVYAERQPCCKYRHACMHTDTCMWVHAPANACMCCEFMCGNVCARKCMHMQAHAHGCMHGCMYVDIHIQERLCMQANEHYANACIAVHI